MRQWTYGRQGSESQEVEKGENMVTRSELWQLREPGEVTIPGMVGQLEEVVGLREVGKIWASGWVEEQGEVG